MTISLTGNASIDAMNAHRSEPEKTLTDAQRKEMRDAIK